MADDAGTKLKKIRERLNLRYRDVEEASLRIAARHGNDEFAVALSRLADIENKGTIPSIYRIYSFCAIYRINFHEVLEWYGINFSSIGIDSGTVEIERTHTVDLNAEIDAEVMLPITLDPGIDPRRTFFLSRVIQKWGKLPLILLSGYDLKGHRYGYIGSDDWSMHPIIYPGSLVLIDDSRRKIATSGWKNEHDRPIYFLESRSGYMCGWCTAVGDQLMVYPHPSSQLSPTLFAADEVEVLGQVDGVAMRINLRRRPRTGSSSTEEGH